MKKLDANTCAHVGFIVKSIDEFMKNLESMVDNVEVLAEVNYPPSGFTPKELNLKYKEQDADFGTKITFIKVGAVTFELFEPTTENSAWHDELEEKGMCFHHINFDVESINEAMDLFRENGAACIQRGQSRDGLTWGYFDTFDKLGFNIEAKNTTHGEVVVEK